MKNSLTSQCFSTMLSQSKTQDFSISLFIVLETMRKEVTGKAVTLVPPRSIRINWNNKNSFERHREAFSKNPKKAIQLRQELPLPLEFGTQSQNGNSVNLFAYCRS